jgi:hypothetical protein
MVDPAHFQLVIKAFKLAANGKFDYVDGYADWDEKKAENARRSWRTSTDLLLKKSG